MSLPIGLLRYLLLRQRQINALASVSIERPALRGHPLLVSDTTVYLDFDKRTVTYGPTPPVLDGFPSTVPPTSGDA